MITLHNPISFPTALKGAAKVTGPGGLASAGTLKSAGYGAGGFYSFNYINRGAGALIDWITSKVGFAIPPMVSRLLLLLVNLYGIRVVGIVLDQMKTTRGTGAAFTIGGMLGAIQGLLVPMLPEGVRQTLSGAGDYGGDLDVIPKQPLGGPGAYDAEFVGQPYFENLNGADPRSEYANAQLNGDEDLLYASTY